MFGLKKLAKLVLKTEVQHLEKAAYHKGELSERERQHVQRNDWLKYEIEQLKDHPVICLDGEHGDLIIGFMAGCTLITQAKVPMPLVHNYIDLTTIIVFGRVFLWTEQRFQALMKLTAEERWALNNCTSNINLYDVQVKEDPNRPAQLGMPQIIQKLTDNRFFEHLAQYEKKPTEIDQEALIN